MEDLNARYRKRFDEIYHDSDMLSYVGYNKENKKIEFMCKKHGLQSKEAYHLFNDRKGCKKCNLERFAENQTSNSEEFIEKAEKLNANNLDDFSLVNYKKSNVLVDIICHNVGFDGIEHGLYKITPNSYLNGRRCPKCKNEWISERQLLPQEEVIEKLREVYKDRPWYDFSSTVYKGRKNKIDIICHKKDKNGNVHGVFSILAEHAIGRGDGCQKCKYENLSSSLSLTTEEFIKRAKAVHGDKWIYDDTEYNGYDVKCKIKCPIHGYFFQNPSSHLKGCGCPSCSHRKSDAENEITQILIDRLGDDNVFTRQRGIISKMKEIDIYLPSKKIGIEYDGCRWHTEQFGKDRYYHLSKTESCCKNGISLIHIFEDEYIHHADIVHSKIRHIIGLDNSKKIYGRKCSIKEISNKESKLFLDENHIQGFASSSIYLGAFHEDKLIGVMSFKRESRNDNKWELNRFATDIKICCVGVGGKLFKYFIKKYHPTMIKSFADRRWTVNEDNNLYTQIGFKFNGYTRPDYKYIDFKEMKRLHKFGFRKKTLYNKYGLPLSMTETEMVKKLGYNKIWDCGLIKYTWTDENS